MAASIVVVSPQFCAPYPVLLSIKQKFISSTGRDFTVKDEKGNDVFRVKGVFFAQKERRELRDAAGKVIITMQEKVFTAHQRWKVFRGKSTSDGDLLFSVKRSRMLQLKTCLHVFLAANTKENVCDFKVKGSYSEKSCTIYLGDSSIIVAQMKKQHNDSIGLTVFPNVDQAFAVGLIMALDEINQALAGEDASSVSDIVLQI